jgi:hypothetical protein
MDRCGLLFFAGSLAAGIILLLVAPASKLFLHRLHMLPRWIRLGGLGKLG